MAEQRIKVPVEALLTALQQRRAEIVKAHEAAAKKHATDLTAWQKKAVAALQATIKQVEDGTSEDYYGDLRVKLPQKPNLANLDTSTIDRDIALLELTTEETIPVSTDCKWSRYLGLKS